MLTSCREGILNFTCSGVCLMTLSFSCCDLNWIRIELITSIESIIIDGLLRLLAYYDIYRINMDSLFESSERHLNHRWIKRKWTQFIMSSIQFKSVDLPSWNCRGLLVSMTKRPVVKSWPNFVHRCDTRYKSIQV